jgi:5-methylcytosine-specific restriction protein A
MTLPFTIGQTYHRVEDIHDEYGGNRYSGIAPCADYPYVFIFYGESGEWHGYDDEFLDDGRFLYTGEGRDGDMTMDAGNEAIRSQQENGDKLHVFEIKKGAWQVTYVGEYEYSDHHWTRLPDRNGMMRDAIRFDLVPAGGLKVDVGTESLDDISVEGLYEQARESVESGPTTRVGSESRTTYPRSEIVKRYALRVADGVCQGCGEDAPFVDEDGEPFLEVHHLHRRSDGGADHPNNVIALCANCHRRVHYGRDGEEFNEELINKVAGKDRYRASIKRPSHV